MRFCTTFAGATVGIALASSATTARAQADRTIIVAPPPAPVIAQPVQAQQPVPSQVTASPPPRDVITEEESAPNRGVIVSGAVMFGLPYAASVVVATESSHAGDGHLYVPVVGPWLDLGDRGGCPATGSCDTETTNKVLLVGDGVLQGIGVLQILSGFVFPEKRIVTRSRPAAFEPKIRLSPARIAPGAYGLRAVGTF